MSDLWLDTKYINLMSNQFRNFKRKNDTLYNLSCPDCGDSTKHKFKARGYFFQVKGTWLYKCHNCGYSVALRSFLKKHSPTLYKEYSLEALRQGDTKGDIEDFVEAPVKATSTVEGIQPLKKINKISQLPHYHSAKKFIDERQIPTTFHHKLFYTNDFVEFTNELIPDKLPVHTKKDPRVIIPLMDENQTLFGFQGRSILKDSIRYITILLNENRPKIYGLDAIDFSKTIYCFEGPFDSMFIPNSLAVCGSDIIQALSEVPKVVKERVTLVYDNEPRSDIINKKIASAIDLGYNVCLWPASYTNAKDVNDMILEGTLPAHIKQTIDTNTYNGLSAKMALSAYRR
jgi:hypothetical protein